MTTTTHQAVQPEFRWLVILVSIGFFMQALDTTIVNTAIPAMAIQLNENPLQMHSVIVAYVLSVAACIPLSGWLADRFGIRNIYLSSMVIFSLASLGCGLSQNLEQLLFFRVIQGIGGITDACRPFGFIKANSTLPISFSHESHEFGRANRSTDGTYIRRLVS
jgi:MFS family permease